MSNDPALQLLLFIPTNIIIMQLLVLLSSHIITTLRSRCTHQYWFSAIRSTAFICNTWNLQLNSPNTTCEMLFTQWMKNILNKTNYTACRSTQGFYMWKINNSYACGVVRIELKELRCYRWKRSGADSWILMKWWAHLNLTQCCDYSFHEYWIKII